MSHERTIGKLPPKYRFILNPYSDVRLSKWPRCDRPTHNRKFALMIHVEVYHFGQDRLDSGRRGKSVSGPKETE